MSIPSKHEYRGSLAAILAGWLKNLPYTFLLATFLIAPTHSLSTHALSAIRTACMAGLALFILGPVYEILTKSISIDQSHIRFNERFLGRETREFRITDISSISRSAPWNMRIVGCEDVIFTIEGGATIAIHGLNATDAESVEQLASTSFDLHRERGSSEPSFMYSVRALNSEESIQPLLRSHLEDRLTSSADIPDFRLTLNEKLSTIFGSFHLLFFAIGIVLEVLRQFSDLFGLPLSKLGSPSLFLITLCMALLSVTLTGMLLIHGFRIEGHNNTSIVLNYGVIEKRRFVVTRSKQLSVHFIQGAVESLLRTQRIRIGSGIRSSNHDESIHFPSLGIDRAYSLCDAVIGQSQLRTQQPHPSSHLRHFFGFTPGILAASIAMFYSYHYSLALAILCGYSFTYASVLRTLSVTIEPVNQHYITLRYWQFRWNQFVLPRDSFSVVKIYSAPYIPIRLVILTSFSQRVRTFAFVCTRSTASCLSHKLLAKENIDD